MNFELLLKKLIHLPQYLGGNVIVIELQNDVGIVVDKGRVTKKKLQSIACEFFRYAHNL